MKIICIGSNYAAHNREMQFVERPEEPTIFFKPDSALRKNNQPFFLPPFSQQIEYEVELVYKIDRLGKNIQEKFAHRYYSQVALGIDFTARDLQASQRQKGGPWEIAKAFDASAALSEFIPLETLANKEQITFELYQNNILKQQGNSSHMLFSIDRIIAYVSQFFTLKIGDLIFTGTPAGVGPVAIGDELIGKLEGEVMFQIPIK